MSPLLTPLRIVITDDKNTINLVRYIAYSKSFWEYHQTHTQKHALSVRYHILKCLQLIYGLCVLYGTHMTSKVNTQYRVILFFYNFVNYWMARYVCN